jgi:hypothetical protein
MREGNVIDFFWEWYRLHERSCRTPLCGLALDKCEEAFVRRDWRGFGYWHAVFVRERQRMERARNERPK